MLTYILIGLLGTVTGFFSGLLGIGGGIILAPLLLYVPQLFGLEPLTMQVVAGLTIVQGLLACLSGSLTHRKFSFVSGRLAATMGISIFVAAVVGGAGSSYVSNQVLLFVFACLAFVAAFLMLVPVCTESERPDVGDFSFSRLRAVSAATGVGLLGGLVGQGGSFILIPLMTSYVQVPTRIAIGSNLTIVLLSSLAAFIGKALTGQIQWMLTIPILISVVPATCLGSCISQKVPVKGLRQLLALVIAAAAICMWISLLG